MARRIKQTTPKKGLSAERLIAVRLFAEGKNITEVAKEMGASRTTITEWRHSPEFQFEIEKLIREGFWRTRNRIATGAIGSINYLVDVGLGKTQPDRDRIKAAVFVVEAALKILPVNNTYEDLNAPADKKDVVDLEKLTDEELSRHYSQVVNNGIG